MTMDGPWIIVLYLAWMAISGLGFMLFWGTVAFLWVRFLRAILEDLST